VCDPQTPLLLDVSGITSENARRNVSEFKCFFLQLVSYLNLLLLIFMQPDGIDFDQDMCNGST